MSSACKLLRSIVASLQNYSIKSNCYFGLLLLLVGHNLQLISISTIASPKFHSPSQFLFHVEPKLCGLINLFEFRNRSSAVDASQPAPFFVPLKFKLRREIAFLCCFLCFGEDCALNFIPETHTQDVETGFGRHKNAHD